MIKKLIFLTIMTRIYNTTKVAFTIYIVFKFFKFIFRFFCDYDDVNFCDHDVFIFLLVFSIIFRFKYFFNIHCDHNLFYNKKFNILLT